MEPGMTDPYARLRQADEDDVIRALEGSYVEDVLDGIAPDVLAELVRRVVDVIVGEAET